MKEDIFIEWMNANRPGKFALSFLGISEFIIPDFVYLRGFPVYKVMN